VEGGVVTDRSRWRRWFLPETPDVVALLVAQGEVSIEAAGALERWARGDAHAADEVRKLEHVADDARRRVVSALRSAFMTPVEPEDLFELSERLDAIVNQAKDLVREAEVLGMAPDEPMAKMAGFVLAGVRQLVLAFPELVRAPDGATAAADLAIREQRQLERAYRRAMSSLLDAHDAREIGGRRELYRRLARTGDGIEHVANRIWYAVVKRG
jgi:uncharacterized protein Yka (UPF0111/DUF47 family)